MSAAKRSPRAMPVETIITRYKSAQQQQQQHQIQKQHQHSRRHRIQKQQQHSGKHRIRKQQQMSVQHRIQKLQHLSDRHRIQKQQNSEQKSMHLEQQTSKQHATEKQRQLPEQHRIQKEQQVTTDQLNTQKQQQVVTEQQKIQKQQQQQLLNKQYSAFTTKSKLISKPANVEKSKRVKSSKDLKKTAKKITIDDRTEFYPEKLKRNINYKRVVLQPKHHMKIIGGTKSCNKRKLHIPQKDVKHIRHNSNSSTLSSEPKSTEPNECPSELSVQDMVLLIEEGGGLDGEDLLEILTCPSPVWWEDPPSGYIEEPLFAKQKPAEQKSIKNQLLDEQNREAERRKQRELESLKAKDIDKLDVSKLGINIDNRGDKFMNKRCKLESLLGTIRNKVKKIDEKVDLNKNNKLNVKEQKSCNNISEFKNVNKNQIIEVQEYNSNNIIEKSVNVSVFNEKPTENVEKIVKNAQEGNGLEPKLNNNDKCVKMLESNKLNSKNRYTKNGDAKRKNRKTKIIKSNIKNIKKLDDANQNYIGNNNDIRNISADSMNREKRNSDSCEDDALLDLEDHEISSFENMKIPVAPNSGACDPRKGNDIVYSNTNDLNKMNKTIFKSISGTEVIPCKAEKQTIRRKLKIPQDRITSDEIVKSIDGRQSKLIKIDSSSKELQKFSFIRVRNLDTLKKLNNETSSDIAGETSFNADDDNKERSRDDILILKNEGKIVDTSTNKIVRGSNCNENNLLSNNKFVKLELSNLNTEVLCNLNIKVSKDKPNEHDTKNDNKFTGETSFNADDDNIERSRDDILILKNEGKIVNTSTNKIVRGSNCNENNLLSNNKFVKLDLSNLNTEVLCNLNIKVSKDKPNEHDTKNDNKFNKRLSPIIDPIADCNSIDNCLSEFKEITVMGEINGSSFDKDTFDDNVTNEDASSNTKTKNYDEDNYNQKTHDLVKNKVETNVRRYSIDSTISDKNMSVEYLDMSLLDEDENKMDIESHNYESEQSQESSGICKNINFKSDLDMTDSNMYDQINKSDNTDIIQYIRDNHKETQHLKDKSDNRIFDLDFTKSENFRSSSPINQNIVSPSKFYQTLDSEEAEYVSVYRIVNSDSESDGNYMTTNDIKIPAVNKNNQTKLTDFSEIKSTAVNENKTDKSETITYEEEYLTEFDDVTIAVNELREKNVDRTNEVKDARNINSNINEASARKDSKGDLLKFNKNKINEGKLSTPEVSKINDVNKHNINNYYKHRKDIIRKRILQKIYKNNPDKLDNTPCKSCSVKNKSILISENDTVKYCLVCSSIYDTEDCKYCMKKLKKECSCERSLEKSEYMCDRCNIKVTDKEMLISHLKLCNVGAIELLM